MRNLYTYDSNTPEGSWPRQWPAPKTPTPDVTVVLACGHDLAFFDPAPDPARASGAASAGPIAE